MEQDRDNENGKALHKVDLRLLKMETLLQERNVQSRAEHETIMKRLDRIEERVSGHAARIASLASMAAIASSIAIHILFK